MNLFFYLIYSKSNEIVFVYCENRGNTQFCNLFLNLSFTLKIFKEDKISNIVIGIIKDNSVLLKLYFFLNKISE